MRAYMETHMQSQWQHGVHQGRRARGISCQSKMEKKEIAYPPSEMGFLDHIMADSSADQSNVALPC